MDNVENQSVEPEEFTISPDELVALVTKRINQGISREKIVQELVSQGNEQARIEPVVYAIYESLLEVAEQEKVTTGSVVILVKVPSPLFAYRKLSPKFDIKRSRFPSSL